MQDGILVFIDLDPITEEPAIHILFGQPRDLYIGHAAHYYFYFYASPRGQGHLLTEYFTGQEIAGHDGDALVGVPEHFQVAAGYLEMFRNAYQRITIMS